MKTVTIHVREEKRWDLRVAVPNDWDAEKIEDAFYSLGGHGFLDELKEYGCIFEVSDITQPTMIKANFRFSEDGETLELEKLP